MDVFGASLPRDKKSNVLGRFKRISKRVYLRPPAPFRYSWDSGPPSKRISLEDRKVVSLVNQTRTDRKGFPWSLAENRELKASHAKGTCPFADGYGLFERSLLLTIPSCLTRQDEDNILQHSARC